VLADRRPVIALVTDAIAPWHRGGKEVRYHEIARRLTAHADVHVYTMKWWSGGSVHRAEGVTYHALSPLLPLYQGERRSIRQAIVFALCCFRLLTARFDVIEADHMPYMQLFPLRIVTWLRRKRLVVTWHELWGPEYWLNYLGPSGRIGWLLESVAMRLPDTIVAASSHTAARIGEFTGGSVPVSVAPNGIDLVVVDGASTGDDPADIVVVGRLLPHKRIDLLLQALAILKEEGLPLTARVVGAGPQLEALTSQAAALGLKDFIDFRQDIDGQEALYTVLKAARVAVFPSEREGFGVAVLEALACGVPVITTSAPANFARFLVEEAGAGGVVCEPSAAAIADAIRVILERAPADPGDISWIAKYDWKDIVDRVYMPAFALRGSTLT
jgi:glycosyltransferase involved in cell wall biosynthesis